MLLKRITSAFILLFILIVPYAFSQNAEIQSPRINEDGSISFYYRSFSTVHKVMLDWFEDYGLGLNAEDLIFTQADSSFWELTIPSIPPGVYRYRFYVDGKYVTDPNNREKVVSPRGLSSMLTVPIFPTDTYHTRNPDIAYGKIENRVYRSSTLGSVRETNIYVPPNYERNKSYPVLYLMHNKEDGSNAWFIYGRIQNLMDQLIADGKVVPMLVVMPFSNSTAHPSTYEENTDQLRMDVISSLVPAVAKWYNVKKEAKYHAIAGVGSGAAEALTLTLHYPGHFNQTGILGYNLPGISETDRKLMASFLKNGHSFEWLFIGDSQDTGQAFSIAEAFDQLEIPYDYSEVAGVQRNWVLWRHLFYREFVPRLFQNR